MRKYFLNPSANFENELSFEGRQKWQIFVFFGKISVDVLRYQVYVIIHPYIDTSVHPYIWKSYIQNKMYGCIIIGCMDVYFNLDGHFYYQLKCKSTPDYNLVLSLKMRVSKKINKMLKMLVIHYSPQVKMFSQPLFYLCFLKYAYFLDVWMYILFWMYDF